MKGQVCSDAVLRSTSVISRQWLMRRLAHQTARKRDRAFPGPALWVSPSPRQLFFWGISRHTPPRNLSFFLCSPKKRAQKRQKHAVPRGSRLGRRKGHYRQGSGHCQEGGACLPRGVHGGSARGEGCACEFFLLITTGCRIPVSGCLIGTAVGGFLWPGSDYRRP